MSDLLYFSGIIFLLPISIWLGKAILDDEIRHIKEDLDKKKKRSIDSSRKLRSLKEEKAHLEKELGDLSSLYAITREMSFDIRFDGLFNSLKNFLEDNFQFETFRVVLFKYEDSERSIDKVYEISKGAARFIEISEVLRNVADFISQSKKPVFIKEEKDLTKFRFSPSISNISAIPLIGRRKIIAAILIENIREEDCAKFLILASQLALQVQRISLFESVERLSIMDGLTQTYLRRYFLERLDEEIKRAKTSAMNLSFIMADLDHFKVCNDSFGHLVGDVVLREVANILKENVREIDLVGRYGGEEFSILLPEAGGSGAYVVAERIRKEIEACVIKAYDETLHITISMGISSFPKGSKSASDLIENADKALYEAKRSGRNRVCLAR